MNDLHELLDRATDRVEASNLAMGALATARRRRTTRRAVAASAVAVVVVAGIAVAGRVGGDRSVHPMQPPPTSGTPSPWNPARVDDLPAAASDVAPGLPDVVEPPATAPALAEQPVDAAVLSVAVGDALLVLATDGTWRSVPPPRDVDGVGLSRDGTRLEFQLAAGVEVWDLPTGQHWRVPAPDGFRDWDYTVWQWLDDDTLLLDDANEGGWRVDARTGSAEQVAYPAGGLFEAVDPDGVLLESSDFSRAPRLTDWSGGEPRRLDLDEVGHLTSMDAGPDTVVGLVHDRAPLSVLVLDRQDAAVRAELPIADDDQATYGNGGLSVVGLLDDGTVLLRVTVSPKPTWRLVAWDPDTGTVSAVTRGEGTVTSYAVAAMG